MKRRKPPSIFRCLQPFVRVSVPAMVLWLFVKFTLAQACTFPSASPKAIPCGEVMPPLVNVILWGVVAVGVFASVYLAHRDFVKGQYYVDLDL